MDQRELALLRELLSYAGHEKDAEALKEALLREFGCLARILAAKPERLMETGCSETAAVLLSAVFPAKRHCVLQRILAEKPLCNTAQRLGEVFATLLSHYGTEQICVAKLDREFRLFDVAWLSRGTVNEAPFQMRELAAVALSEGTAFLAMAHNHPEGKTEPSDADIATTQGIVSCLEGLDVPLLEHFIVCGEDYRPILLCRHLGMISSKINPTEFYTVAMRKLEGLSY